VYKLQFFYIILLYISFVNVGPGTPEYKRVVGVHPSFKNLLRQIISGST